MAAAAVAASSTVAAAPTVNKSSPSVESATSVKSTSSLAARVPSMAKTTIIRAMTVMPEDINIRPPDTPVIVWAIIVIIGPIPTRPTVVIVAVSFATR